MQTSSGHRALAMTASATVLTTAARSAWSPIAMDRGCVSANVSACMDRYLAPCLANISSPYARHRRPWKGTKLRRRTCLFSARPNEICALHRHRTGTQSCSSRTGDRNCSERALEHDAAISDASPCAGRHHAPRTHERDDCCEKKIPKWELN